MSHLLFRETHYLLAVDPDTPLVRLPSPLDKPKNRRLPGSAPSENGKRLAKRHSHRDVLQDLSIAEPHRDICKLNHGRPQSIPCRLHGVSSSFTLNNGNSHSQRPATCPKPANLLKRLLLK